MDVILIWIFNRPFPPYYFFSFAIIVVLALLISLIRKRSIQIVVATFLLTIKAIFVISNAVTYRSQGFIFDLESIRLLEQGREFEAGLQPIWLEVFGIIMIFALFLTLSIAACIKFKNIPAGFKLEKVAAVFCAIAILITSQGIFFRTLPKHYDNIVDNMARNARFNLDTFDNKPFYVRNFGLTMFIIRDLLEVMGHRTGIRIYVPPPDRNPEAFEFELGPDYNLMLILLESVEKSALHPILTPNLWRLMNMSTVVDGFFTSEVTGVAEYLALTGSHIHGAMNGSNNPFRNVVVPQALPHVFKRSGIDQTAAFHANSNRTVYGRNSLFTPEVLGFDYFLDGVEQGVAHMHFGHLSSDKRLFDRLINYMAPGDKSFFSYVATISGHHYGFNFVRNVTIPIRDEQNAIIRNRWGRPVLEAAYPFQSTMSEINGILDLLKGTRDFPHLLVANETDYLRMIHYMIAVRDLDNGIGILMNHLNSTPDIRRDPSGNTMLIDTTALVLFSDHHTFLNSFFDQGNMLLGGDPNLHGEQCVFIIYNPTDTDARHRGGRIIERFTSMIDVYPTIAHLFGFEVDSRFTHGVSIFDAYSHSIGYRFRTDPGYAHGICRTTGGQYMTTDYLTFRQQNGGVIPCQYTITRGREALLQIHTAINFKEPLFRNNTLRFQEAAHYIMRGAISS